MKKKILSVFMTIAMLLSMATMFAGTVSANNVDLSDGIDNYDELEAFIASLATKDYAGETVELNADIKVNDGWVANDGTSGAVQQPAVTLDTAAATNAFKGTFDGNGNTISGLYMTGMAFFPTVDGAIIKDVTFDNCASTPKAYTSGKNAAAIVVGRLTSGSITVSNVVVKNSKIVNGTTTCYIGTFIGLTESNAGPISFENCESVACNLYAGAKTSLIGGIAGTVNAASGTVLFKNCISDTDIVATGENNAGYKCGGIIGYNGAVITVQNCVNTGDILSQTIAAGIVADTSAAVTVENCVNKGNMIASATSTYDGIAGGIFGRLNNASSATAGCSITGSINTGAISATTVGTGTNIQAGGMVGFAQFKRDRLTVTINQCVNQGNVEAGVNGGGAIGYLNSVANTNDINADEIYIASFVNTGNVTAGKKAGGLVGLFNGTSGRIDKAITVGTVIGYNGTPTINTGASCAMFGSWAQNNGTDELEIVDFFYSNNGNDNVFGLWALLGTTYNNHNISYTATEKSLDFEPGETNAGEGDNTHGKNLAIYNKFFVENGYAVDATDFYAEKGANTFKAFNLGVDWMLTDTVPVPASVFALMDAKVLEKNVVDYVGYQANVEGALSSIRIIAGLNDLNCTNTGFELYMVKKGEEALYADKNTSTVYNAINVYDAEGNLTTPYTNKDYKYLSAITVTCSAEDLGDSTTFIVRSYVTVDGAKIYGARCAIVIAKTGGTLSVVNQYVM